MVTREEVIAQIQKVPEKHLEELFRIVKAYEGDGTTADPNQNVMAQLRRIRISASPDFSVKANLYDLEERDAT